MYIELRDIKMKLLYFFEFQMIINSYFQIIDHVSKMIRNHVRIHIQTNNSIEQRRKSKV